MFIEKEIKIEKIITNVFSNDKKTFCYFKFH